mgnify:FL=1
MKPSACFVAFQHVPPEHQIVDVRVYIEAEGRIDHISAQGSDRRFAPIFPCLKTALEGALARSGAKPTPGCSFDVSFTAFCPNAVCD